MAFGRLVHEAETRRAVAAHLETYAEFLSAVAGTPVNHVAPPGAAAARRRLVDSLPRGLPTVRPMPLPADEVDRSLPWMLPQNVGNERPRQRGLSANLLIVDEISTGITPYRPPRLLPACRDGDAALVEIYLQEGDDVNVRNGAAILYACEKGRTDVVRVLLQYRITLTTSEIGISALIEACEGGHLDVVKLLVSSGAITTRGQPLYVACKYGYIEIVAYLLSELPVDTYNVHSAVYHAAANGRVAVLRLLAAKGASLHSSEARALRYASYYGRTKVVEYLLADNKATQAELDSAATQALEQCNYDTLDLLSAAGASFDLEEMCNGPGDSVTKLIEIERWEDLERLVLAGAHLELDQWLCVPLDLRPRLAAAHTDARFGDLPASLKPLWDLFHRSIKRRLLRGLRRARYRLDRPPTEPLGTDAPTREQLIAHLRTAGRRFAREYWTEGLEIFFPGQELGGVPEEFMPVRLGAQKA